jgi:hypothetical protein
VVLARIPVETQARAAAVQLITDFAADAGLQVQVWPGRPHAIFPPTAFVDAINEALSDYTTTNRQRRVQVQVLVLHGMYDTADTVAQRDRFVDGFLDWVVDRPHAAGGNTLLEVTTVQDEPSYVPDWLPSDVPRVYYASRVWLEGFAAT